MNNQTFKTIVHPLLAVVVITTPVIASAAQRYNLFKQVTIDFAEELVFERPAMSAVQCVGLCASTPCCDRAIFSEGMCQGHRWTTGEDSSKAVVWERENANTDVIRGKPAVQDRTYTDWFASKAVDGIFTDDYCSFTNDDTDPPHWWQVDMLATYSVLSVTIDNSQYSNEYRQDFAIHVYTEDPQTNPDAIGSLCYHYDSPTDTQVTLRCSPSTAPGRFLRITTMTEGLLLCEVEAEACLVSS